MTEVIGDIRKSGAEGSMGTPLRVLIDIPFIIVSETISGETALDAMKKPRRVLGVIRSA